MQILIDSCGQATCLYGENIQLSVLGKVSITRASHVEPDETGRWWVDLSPVKGPTIGPFNYRSAALDAERQWLESNALTTDRQADAHSFEWDDDADWNRLKNRVDALGID